MKSETEETSSELSLFLEFEKLGETQKKILTASVAVFAEKGFYGSRTEDIAHRAGVNKAMLHYYFKSKEALYITMIEMMFQKVSEMIGKHLIEMKSDNIDEDIARFIYRYTDFLAANRSILKILTWELARGGSAIANSAKKTIGPRRQDLLHAFSDAVGSGKIRPMDFKHLFINIIGMSIFYFIANPVMNILWEDDLISPENIEIRKKEVADFVINAIKPR